MNGASLLLLVTLVQSQSDGVLLSDSENVPENLEEGFQDFQPEDWEEPESPLAVDLMPDYGQGWQPSKKRSTSDAFTRRSALDKNFMRFGRVPRAAPRQFCGRGRAGPSDGKPSFFRFGRGSKDNFIRFGRGGKDGFIRFGRARPEDFFRAGKSVRDNFIRFGKAEGNVLRFGGKATEEGDRKRLLGEYPASGFESVEQSSRPADDFRRAPKSGGSKEGRNGTNFLRFGKKDATETEEVDPEEASGVRGKRKRRAAEGGEPQGNRNENPKVLKRSSTGYFEQLPENFPRRLSPLFAGDPWQTLENLRNSRLTPFFPVTSKFVKSSFFSEAEPGWGAKRNQGGGSNFIRFG